MSTVHIDGIVAMRDKQPYVRIHIDGKVAQLSIAQARKIAADIVEAAARTEADAMIHKFFSAQGYPEGANVAVMMAFRDFRLKLDEEPVEGSYIDPDRKDDPLQ